MAAIFHTAVFGIAQAGKLVGDSLDRLAAAVTTQSEKIRQQYCERFHRVAGPWQDSIGLYERCLECGRRIPWNDPYPISSLRQSKPKNRSTSGTIKEDKT
jgi:hypothetical protein